MIQVTMERANSIIDTRQPYGNFCMKDNNLWVGIDNSTGDAWTEEFVTLDECIGWINREAVTPLSVL